MVSNYPFDVSPRIENGRTMVPLRAIFEALGAQIQWDETSKTVTAVKDSTTSSLLLIKKQPIRTVLRLHWTFPGK
jgi:hypothetical protein